jgi:sigma-B regulation protein RsbU (phosphoserine phosphatase)
VTSIVHEDTVAIAVHNEGVPIPVSAQAGLFQPMARGTSASSAGRGVGLGLFIVSEIAKAHGGKAIVQSTLEEGLPLRCRSRAERRRGSSALTGRCPGGRGLSVL